MKNRWISGLLIAAAIFAAASIPRDDLSGRVTVVDGDTLKMGTTSIRLHAVDAPERDQHCGKGASRWPCGTAATTKLAALIGEGEIVCKARDLDQYGRTVAVCRSGKTDLAAALVAAGLALAYREYGSDYVDEEDEARAARRGVWVGDFTPPWEWRRNESPRESPRESRDAPAADAPAPPGSEPPVNRPRGDCSIKGNINSEGVRIYHLPGSRYYDETIIDPAKGERWFCSVPEAEQAGWRAPRGR